MAVLAIAQILFLGELAIEGAWELAWRCFWCVVGAQHSPEVVRDHAIILRRVLIGTDGQTETGRMRGGAIVGGHFSQHFVIVCSVNNNSHVFVVFRSSTHHGRAADIDVLDRIFQRATGFGHGLREWVQVHHD